MNPQPSTASGTPNSIVARGDCERPASWPVQNLEVTGKCPVCGEERRRLIHGSLLDNTYRCAPGRWRMWQCSGCRSAYLDPRPTPLSIHGAYKSYYTHRGRSAADTPFDQLSPWRKLRRRLVNGFLNRRFGASFRPSSSLGVPLAKIPFPLLRQLERKYRNLPKPSAARSRLLDIGCGNGSFLTLAAECGWDVHGIDPDPKAASAAAERGFAVQIGALERLSEIADHFDAITINHVIEHVHDPIALLTACNRLLRAGGTLWLETPNIDAQGHTFFGEHWRGLRVPPPSRAVQS